MEVKGILRASVNLVPYTARQHIRRVPGVAMFQRWLINKFMSDRPFLHTINAGPAAGLRFEISLPSDKAIWSGTFEPLFATALVAAVRPGDICYDVGGYRGYMAGAMALRGAAQVVIFEPLARNVEALHRLCDLNPRLRLQVLQFAIGDRDGRANFKAMPDASMGKLGTSVFQIDARALSDEQVDVRRLDTLIAKRDITPPDIIKIDVEGAELEVLDGAQTIIAKHKPIIFLEAHSTALEAACSAKLRSAGYSVRTLEPPPFNDEETRHLQALPSDGKQ